MATAISPAGLSPIHSDLAFMLRTVARRCNLLVTAQRGHTFPSFLRLQPDSLINEF